MRSSNQWLINLSKDESLWAKELDSVPSMIHFEYMQLKNLAEQGQVYGVLLQCKDTYETILRIPVIMALVVIDSDPKYKDGSEYNDIMKAFLESPMSMGNWNNLARVIIKNNKKLNLPENLIKILERTRKLYNTEITTKVSDVVAWRNDTIGHGALKFEDDANYQEEVKSLLNLLKEYFDGEGKLSIKRLYDSIYFQCGENKLVGDCYDKNAEHDLFLHIAGNSYIVSNYINDSDLKWYLFESFYCRKNLVKYSSYIDGKNNTVQNKYFADLYERHVLQGNKDVAVASDYISRAEDLILEYLNMPTDYVKPEKLVELLQEQMDALGKGVITIFMERGTGKSAFANQMSGLYHSKPLLKNTLSRCYHVSNTALRGVSDFTNSITNGFRHSFNPADDLWGSTEELPSLTLESEKPAEDMAEFLNFYHDKYRKDYTILVIDGIDETTEQSEFILNYIPSKERLDDGVFVVLTTRFSDEKTVQGKSKKYIEKATQLADGQLEIRRHDEINTELLKRYIEKHESRFSLNNSIDKEALIKKSDYRILYLRAYLAMKDQVALDSTNETKFIESYMNYLLLFYGINQKQKLKEIAVSIALFPSISIKKYQEYLNCQEITYEFVGLFNDLLPLLTVVHFDGEDCYEFADAAYEDFVIEEYPDVVKDVIRFFYQSLENNVLSRAKITLDNGVYYNPFLVEEKKINNDILFFSTGMLSIWEKSKNHKNVSNLFFDQVGVLHLYKIIQDYPWGRYGYGKILKKELSNCILQCLYEGMKEKCGKKYRIENNEKWLSKTNQFVCQNDFCEFIYSNKTFIKIRDMLITNYLKFDAIEDWFWVLSRVVSLDVVEIVKHFKKEIAFVKYIFGKFPFDRNGELPVKLKYKWTELLLNASFTSKNETVILNHILVYYKNNRSECRDKGLIEAYIDKIKRQGYQISIEPKMVERLVNHGVQKRILRNMFHSEVKKATKILLNYCEPIVADSADYSFPYIGVNLGIGISRTYDFLKHVDKAIVDEDDVKALHVAYYNRICYELKNRNLVKFLEAVEEPRRNKPFENIELCLQAVCGKGETCYEELAKLIKAIKNEVDKQQNIRFFNILLAQMLYFGVRHLEDNKLEDKSLLALEELVYEIDTKATFSSCFADSSLKKELKLLCELPNIVYCTNNSLYLLVKLYERGKTNKVDKLLKSIEDSIVIVDRIFDSNGDSKIMQDISKVRFLFVRKYIRRQNDLDSYLEKSIKERKERIDLTLKSLSRNSDFKGLTNDINVLVEFYWWTKCWGEGEIFCGKLIELLINSTCHEDKIIEEILRNEIETIKNYKDFFGWLTGKELHLTNGDAPLLSQSSVYENIFPLQKLFRENKNLMKTKVITVEELQQVERLIKFKLAHYSW